MVKADAKSSGNSMPSLWRKIDEKAMAFSGRWKDARNEEAQAQSFVADFLRVFGVSDPGSVGNFEYKVPLSDGKTGYIDYLWVKKIAIEMKSRGKNLDDAKNQLQNYLKHLPPDDIPDLWLVCDFENMRLIRRSVNREWSFKTIDLRKKTKLFADIAGYSPERVYEDRVEANVKAAEKMAKLHDSLKSLGYDGHNLEVYLVRLLFCLFSDSTNIFPRNNFLNYIETSKDDGSDLSSKLASLFEILDTPEGDRNKRPL
ncbi:MAG: class I SAM-dependent DNA methyltransferase, partial [Deltaproteobacteria bacterium]|nr:class I SAM-dependent DNA methyltransferase [Deltaproteobacteria bacterium]